MTVENDKPLKPNLVNIRKVFHDKSPRLASLLPGFVYKYLERVLHQHDLNDILTRHGDKYGLEFARATVDDFKVTITVLGAAHLVPGQRYIFASNHPLGGLEGFVLMDVIGRYYSNLKVLANDILMNIVNLAPVFLPVNKHGKQAAELAKNLHEAYLSDMQILTFPAGLVSRYINKKVMDLEWKKNFITKAITYQRDVVPVHVSGKNSKFFYRLYQLRKLLGIKANIEMFYLVDETFRHRGEHITITFGPPISYTAFDNSKTPAQWAKWVKEQSYSLAGVTNVPL
jgi:1-acyl-sn-glycerol-3-phosphate acyltransferase